MATRPRRRPARAQRPHRDPTPAAQASPSGRWRIPAGIAVILVATALAYLPCVHGGFILDDHLLLTQSPVIAARDGVYRIWLTTDAIDYWPVSNTSLWLEWRAWGLDPTGYHVTNIALHAATALLLWAVLAALSIPGGFVAALLFALHPVNVESVAWIAQRKDLLALLFGLTSAYAYVHAGRGPHAPRALRRWYWGSLVAFLVAMLSKSSIAVLPLLLLCVTWWRRPLTRHDLLRIAPFCVIAGALVLVNSWFQARFTEAIVRSPIERVLGAAAVLWFYLGKAVLPIDLSFVYPRWTIQPDRVSWWLPLLGAVAVSAVLWRRRHGAARPLLVAWAVFVISLAPVMGFVDVGFMEHSLVADHYQHLALLAVVTVAGAGWSIWRARLRHSRRWLADGAAVIVTAALALLTWQQSGLYRDGVTLFRATIARNPDSWFAHNNLGLALLEAGRPHDALPAFTRALELAPDQPAIHYNLARVLRADGRLDDAIVHYQQALRQKVLDSYNAELAAALVEARRLPEAIEHFQLAVQLQPDSAEAENNLGAALLEAGRVDDAIDHFTRSTQLSPALDHAHANLGRALLHAGQPGAAVEHLRVAVRLDPDNPDHRDALGVALIRAGEIDAAVVELQHAARLKPDDANVRENLEEALDRQRHAAAPE